MPLPLLWRGAQGPSVTLLQQRLSAKGSDIGVDGIFGRSKYDAVVTFQASRTLAPDGIVDKSTWSALA